MESVQVLSALVGELGFPIAITIALFYQNIKNNDVLKEMNINISKLTLVVDELRKERS